MSVDLGYGSLNRQIPWSGFGTGLCFASGVVIVRQILSALSILGLVFPAGGGLFSGGLRYPTEVSVQFRALSVLMVFCSNHGVWSGFFVSLYPWLPLPGLWARGLV